MNTDRRLTKAYETAPVVYFDDESKYVFLSDCHRGNGNISDEFSHNENVYLYALRRYFDDGYTHVEVGDGDELWEHRLFREINVAHHEAFDAIKQFFDDGRFILIWGNHNNFLRDPEYVRENLETIHHMHTEAPREFLKGIQPREAIVLKHLVTGQELFVVHGHQGDFPNDQAWVFTMLMLKHFWAHLHAFGFRNPASPAKNSLRRHKIERTFSKWIAVHRKALICGHTHRFRFPEVGEVPYFNSGSCIYPRSITAIELDGGEIRLVRWRLIANSEGLLEVVRQVLRGPEPVSAFDIR